ncbi:MAG: cellulase family glycosylhydrolase [Clostridia bacterium]|nr:cellulase family glycosylhydrolase [Clostridia bacterium]
MRTVQASVHNQKGVLDRFFSGCIGIGRAGEVMRYIPMQQLKRIQRECPFRYIRFHGIFHEEMNLVSRDEEGKLHFSFRYVDQLFDTLLENGIRPVAELGLMPVAMASEEKSVFWWKLNVSMPRDIAEWNLLIETFMRHITERYGEDEVATWYFEIWNEPNHPSFFTEYKNIDAYFTLYDTAARAIKRVSERYRVGGPATAGMIWIDKMVEHCRASGVPLDFITSHSYGIKGDFDPDGTAITYLPTVDKVAREVRHHGAYCHENGLPLIITEWSSSYSGRDPIHDHYFNAVYLLRAVKQCEGYADMLSYWTFSDIFEELLPPDEPFHGGFGLFNMQSIPKPIYHAYRFLHALGDTELVCEDENAYVCQSDDAVQVLFWNISHPEGKVANRRHFSSTRPAAVLDDATVIIEGLTPETPHRITRETVGYRMADPYTHYLSGAYGTLTTREQTEALMKTAVPAHAEYEAVTDAHGTLTLTVPQTENQADLLVIRPATTHEG